MTSVHSLTTAPINIYSKTYWTSFIAAVNEEAAFELGLHDRINPEAIRQSTRPGWSAALFTPNILRNTDVYIDRSTNIDLSSHTHEHHHHEAPSLSRPLPEEEREAQRKQEEEDSLDKYKWLGPIIGSVGAFLSAYTWSGYQRCKATYDHTRIVQRGLTYGIAVERTPLKPILERIVDVKLKVDEIRYKIIHRYFWACAGILVGGGLFTLGAYTRQPRLISWGGIALAISAIWGAASAGFHWQDNKNIRKLYTVIALYPERLADLALYNFHQFYQEGMTLYPQYVQNPQYFVPPGGYQPFFGGAQEFQAPPPPTFSSSDAANTRYAVPSAPYLYSEQLG